MTFLGDNDTDAPNPLEKNSVPIMCQQSDDICSVNSPILVPSAADLHLPVARSVLPQPLTGRLAVI
jgi:hypothetical protein